MSVGIVPLPVAPVKAPFPSCPTSSPKLFTCRTSGKSLKSLPPTTVPTARLVSRYRNANSFTFMSFADPHPLNSVVSYRYKNSRGGGSLDAAANRRCFFALCPNAFALNPFADPHLLSPVVSHLYKKGVGEGGRSIQVFPIFRIRRRIPLTRRLPSQKPPLLYWNLNLSLRP